VPRFIAFNKAFLPSLSSGERFNAHNPQVIIDSKGDQYWYDTRYGDKIAIGSKSYGYILLKEEGGMKERFDKEFELVEALKELD